MPTPSIPRVSKHDEYISKQAVDLTSFGIDVDVEISGCGRQTRDSLDVSRKSIPAKLLTTRLTQHSGRVETYKYPAPAAILTSLTGTVKPVGAPLRAGS
jgi:hypothetical protein